MGRTRGIRAAAALALVAGCGTGPGEANVTSDTLFIGVAATRSTATSVYFNGVNLAIEHLNENRPADTRPFGIRLPPQDQSSQVAVAAAFRDDPTVVGVVGHTGSGQTLEAAPVYGDVDGGERRALVAVSPTATNPVVTRASRWVFRVCPTDLDGAAALAAYTADSLGLHRADLVYRNDLFGRGFLRTFRPVFEAHGGTITDRYPYLAEITEYEAYAGTIARRRTPAVVFAGGSEDVLNLVRALRAVGVRPTVLGTDDVAGLTGNPEAIGVRYISFFQADRVQTDHARAFVADYEAQFGEPPDHRAALAYDAARLIGAAVLEVGPDRSRIRDVIAQPTGAVFEGVTGRIQFDEHGDVIDKPIYIAEIGR